MRRLASFLLLGVALAASATEVWRWKDADGVVHYSDSPVAGAERINVSPAPKPGSVATAPPSAGAAVRESDPTERYRRCEITQPTNDQTFNAVDGVNASVMIEPRLQTGHHIQAYLNGGAYPQWPETAMSYTFAGLYRGSYTLSVRVLDASDRTLCAGPAINFHVQQPSALSPARQPPRK